MKVLLLLVLAAAVLADAAPSGKEVHRATPKRRPLQVDQLPGDAVARRHATSSRRAGAGLQISGGMSAAVGQFPWMAYITMDSSWVCGGSLISDSFVLTAAQCASGFEQFLIIVGEIDLFFEDSPFLQYAYTYKSFVHEGYEEDLWINDIALLQVLSPFKITAGVSPVKLPQAADAANMFVGKSAIISGWGDEYDFAMEYVSQPVMDTSRCSRFFADNDDTGLPFVHDDIHLCGDGEGGVGACGEDLGGPLVIQGDDNSWTQIGVWSFGSNIGCKYGYPSVYTRVTAFLDWITKRANLPAPNSTTPSTSASP